MLIQCMEANIKLCSESVRKLERASDIVINAVNEKELSGAAYEAGKHLFSDVVIPTIKKTTDSITSAQASLDKYIKADNEICSEEWLDEVVLETQKEALVNLKNKLNDSIKLLELSDVKCISTPIDDKRNDLINEVKGVVKETDRNIKSIERKLQKLRSFEKNTSSLFKDDLENLKIAIQDIAYLGDMKINVKTGEYILPSGVKIDSFSKLQDDDETLDKTIGVIKNNTREIYEAAVKYHKGKQFLKGKDITVEKVYEGTSRESTRVRWDDKPLYDQNSDQLFKSGRRLKEASGIDMLKNRYAWTAEGGINYSEMGKASWDAFKSSMNPLEDFTGWKGASHVTKIGKFMGIVGTSMSVMNNINEDFIEADGGVYNSENWTNFTIDTGVDLTFGAGAAAAGAAAGSLVAPPIGTVVGAAVGIGVSCAMNVELPSLDGKSITDWAKDSLKGVFN